MKADSLTPSQRYKASQEAIDPDRKPRQTWCNKEEHGFMLKALFAYRECGNGLNAMEKLLTDMNKEEVEP